jgi:hypothetical protein
LVIGHWSVVSGNGDAVSVQKQECMAMVQSSGSS